MRVLRAVLVVSVAAVALTPTVARAQPGSRARSATRPTATPMPPPKLGVTPGGVRVEFDVVLRYRQHALDAFLARVNDPRSSGYHHYASPDEIGGRFGISDEGVARVSAWLAASGLDVVETFPQRTTIRVAGPAADVDKTLHVTLIDKLDPVSGQQYHRPRGTPRVPPALDDVVEGVAGLDTRRGSSRSNPCRLVTQPASARRALRVSRPTSSIAASTSPRCTTGGSWATASMWPSSWTDP
jgi:kumamolisin